MKPPFLASLLMLRLPFYYGWVVLACVCLAGFARQGPAVAVLSVFVTPMTQDFGWSRTAISGAVSLGGVLAAVISPVIGPVLDRQGARLVLCLAVLGVGLATMALSLVQSLAAFYLLFCFARMVWAGPYDLGLYGALNAWFVARRQTAVSIATLAQMSGLVALPIVAQLAMRDGGWRNGWVAVGACVLLVGFLPAWLLLVRRPEDVGLAADRVAGAAAAPEPRFSRAAAMRTPAFWLLSLYTVLVFPVQAGVSLHQAPHLIERGLAPITAASAVAVFSAMSAVASFGVGFLPRRWPVRHGLLLAAVLLAIGSFALIGVGAAHDAMIAGGLFGLGIGSLMTLLPVAWADYFGRESYGAIRGVALSLQVLAQAAGPVLSGVLRDSTGTYTLSLLVFGALASLAALVALAARQPPAIAAR
ncbi:MFS transporter [Vineibacter terrae]|uniref:MFS transporter n=1 Tax=Vineibacter terrae TaxID=2586908 RepID=UPI002E32619C|nr:MFS transporter [Vineibacter terrae]HEX2892071.1 MFS transporter [Vineibacter terrae]